MMQALESGTIAVMILCGALALAGCTAAALVAVFVSAAVVRAAIEVKHLIEEAGQ